MRFNEMSVDTNAFGNVAGKMRRRCEELRRLSEAMTRNLVRVNAQFTSPNFIRAQEVIGGIQRDLSNALSSLDNLKRFFDELEYCINDYQNNKFRG